MSSRDEDLPRMSDHRHLLVAARGSSEGSRALEHREHTTARRDAHLLQKRRLESPLGGSKEELSVSEMSVLAHEIVRSKSARVVTLRSLSKCFSTSEEHCQAFLGVENSLASLVGCLCGNDSEMQLEAACCLVNLSFWSGPICQRICDAASVYLITLIGGGDPTLQLFCAWSLTNLCAEKQKLGNLLSKQGLLPSVERLLKSSVLRVQLAGLQLVTSFLSFPREENIMLQHVFGRVVDVLECSVSSEMLHPEALHAIFLFMCNSCTNVPLPDWERAVPRVLHLQTSLSPLHVAEQTLLPDGGDGSGLALQTVLWTVRVIGNAVCSEQLNAVVESCIVHQNEPVCACWSSLLHSSIDCLLREALWMVTNLSVRSGLHRLLSNSCVLESVKTLLERAPFCPEETYVCAHSLSTCSATAAQTLSSALAEGARRGVLPAQALPYVRSLFFIANRRDLVELVLSVDQQNDSMP